MRPDAEEKLFGIEPKWFNRERGPMSFGFEHGDGWASLVEGLLRLAQTRRAAWVGLPQDNPFAPGRFEVRQVLRAPGQTVAAGTTAGATAGMLRFIFVGGDEAFREAAREAEVASGQICEECGQPGSTGPWKHGRLRTLCGRHGGAP